MKRSRVDRNQPEIVAVFRKFGFVVFHVHMVGRGYPDIHIARNGFSALIEIKDGRLPPSKRELTQPERDFHDTWPAPVFIVCSVDDAIELARELP